MRVHDPLRAPRTTHHAQDELAGRVATPRVGAKGTPEFLTHPVLESSWVHAVLDGLMRAMSTLARLPGVAIIVDTFALAFLPAVLISQASHHVRRARADAM